MLTHNNFKSPRPRRMHLAFIALCISLFSTPSLFGFRAEYSGQTRDEKPATIKVLLERDMDGALLEVKGGFKVLDPVTGKRLSSGSRGKRYFVFPMSEGIKWGEEFLGIHQISVVPTSSDTTFLLNGTQFRGAIHIYMIEDRLSFVNETDVEHFLKVSLAHSLPDSTHSAVRDAVAIISRTNAYYTALSNHDAYWHVDKKNAKYEGYIKAFSDSEMDRSIDNTKYLVMTYDSQPFAAGWTENSAGHTASYATIFRKNVPTPKGVETKFALKDRSDYQWKYALTSSEFARLLKINRVSELDLFVDHRSSKVYGVRVKDGSHVKDVGVVQLRRLIGDENLKSTDFSVKLKNGKVSFSGYGKGLGVGLCLYSATQMAENGELAPRILADFFPFTHLEKMRSYPDMIISPSTEYFIAPKKKRHPDFDEKDMKEGTHEPTRLKA